MTDKLIGRFRFTDSPDAFGRRAWRLPPQTPQEKKREEARRQMALASRAKSQAKIKELEEEVKRLEQVAKIGPTQPWLTEALRKAQLALIEMEARVYDAARPPLSHGERLAALNQYLHELWRRR